MSTCVWVCLILGLLCMCICTTPRLRLATERRGVLLISAPRPATGVALNLWKLLSRPQTAEGRQRGTEGQGFHLYQVFPFLLSAVLFWEVESRCWNVWRGESPGGGGSGGLNLRQTGRRGRGGSGKEGRQWERRKMNDTQEAADAIKKITSGD